MTAAIFGLLGVIVGAAINGGISAVLQRRVETSDRRSAARLVRSELVSVRSIALETRAHAPEDLPQLRDMTPVLWQANRSVLARALPDAHWALVARAYAHVDAARSVLLFEPDGTLAEWRTRESLRLLAEAIEPVEQAALALGEAAGLESSGDAGDGRAPTPPDFPEAGPVAA